jgi:hypothetical protein
MALTKQKAHTLHTTAALSTSLYYVVLLILHLSPVVHQPRRRHGNSEQALNTITHQSCKRSCISPSAYSSAPPPLAIRLRAATLLVGARQCQRSPRPPIHSHKRQRTAARAHPRLVERRWPAKRVLTSCWASFGVVEWGALDVARALGSQMVCSQSGQMVALVPSV